MKRYKIGYTQGVFDMFHIGHLNLLNKAKESCEYLIVGINADKLVQTYKNKIPVIDEFCRKKIVENIKVVDKACLVYTLDKIEVLKNIYFNVVYVGDDWKNDKRWIQTVDLLATVGVDVIFLPYTKNISSTILRNKNN
jgi:glycerol-3-phosphate cytidylyltransferase